MFGAIIAVERDLDTFERDVLRKALMFVNRTNLALAPLLPAKATYNEITSKLDSWGKTLARGSDSDVTLTLPQVQKAVDLLIEKGLTNKETGKIVFLYGWKMVKELMVRIQPTMTEEQRTRMLRVPFETDLALLQDISLGRSNAPDRLAAISLLKDVASRVLTLAIKRRSRMIEEEEQEEKRAAAAARVNKQQVGGY